MPTALTFDVFGTVVDWRTSIIREGEELGRKKGLALDWAAFADGWRALYKPLMKRVQSGALPWTKLDDLHRMGLDQLLAEHGVTLSEEEKVHFNKAWHRLDPWPDVIPGFERLKKRFTLAALSNGNVALINNMAKRAGIPWDLILGAEIARHYKTDPEIYQSAMQLLDLPASEVMMVAAHNFDLEAARSLGMKTAFIPRPDEHGKGKSKDSEPSSAWDVVANGMVELADQLGA